jgi:catalase
MTADERTRLVENIAGNLSAAQPFIQERAIANFTRADGEYGKRIGELVAKIRTQKKDAAVPFLSAGKPAVRPKL